MWKIRKVGKVPELKDPILLEGLPGIGNVGKVAVDFLAEELGAKKIYEFTSYHFPHSVFVNERNLVELPSISLYYKQFSRRKHDLLFLIGDIQPIDEVSCYEFCEEIMHLLQELGGDKVVALGGIGLQQIPKKPKVYVTGAVRKHVMDFKKGLNVSGSLYGVVGPIVGVTGVLMGIAPQYKVQAIGLLVETFGHPMYLGVKGAKELLNILKKKLGFKVSLKKMEEEIEELEKEVLKKTKEIRDVGTKRAIERAEGEGKLSYIG